MATTKNNTRYQKPPPSSQNRSHKKNEQAKQKDEHLKQNKIKDNQAIIYNPRTKLPTNQPIPTNRYRSTIHPRYQPNQPTEHHPSPLSHRNLCKLHHRAIRSNHADPRSPSTSTSLPNNLRLPCPPPLSAIHPIPLAGLLPPISRGAPLAIAPDCGGGSSFRLSCPSACQGGLRFGCGSGGGGSFVGLALRAR